MTKTNAKYAYNSNCRANDQVVRPRLRAKTISYIEFYLCIAKKHYNYIQKYNSILVKNIAHK